MGKYVPSIWFRVESTRAQNVATKLSLIGWQREEKDGSTGEEVHAF